MLVYRSMRESSDGFPEPGPGGRLLGVRPGNTMFPDVLADIPSDMVLPGEGGMSVAPLSPMGLPRHRRPPALGGIGVDPVWCLDTDDLGSNLQFTQDRPSHGFIEPKQPMTLKEYQEALANTRSRWIINCR